MAKPVNMLVHFLAEQYRSEPFHQLVSELRTGPLANATARSQVTGGLLPFLLPHLVAAIEQLITQGADKPRVRAFAGGLLTYVYNPLDLYANDGLAGWIDDVLICALGLRRLVDLNEIILDPLTLAVCDFATSTFEEVDSSLRTEINTFLTSLWEHGISVKTHP